MYTKGKIISFVFNTQIIRKFNIRSTFIGPAIKDKEGRVFENVLLARMSGLSLLSSDLVNSLDIVRLGNRVSGVWSID